MESNQSTSPATLCIAAQRLRDLARNYRSDCEVRIEIVTEECLSVLDSLEQEDAKEYRDQIGHWQATIKMIDRITDWCDPILADPVHSPALPQGRELTEMFAEDRRIAVPWEIEDVLEVREDLSDEEAWEVLRSVKQNHDACIGINWEVLEYEAERMFPREI